MFKKRSRALKSSVSAHRERRSTESTAEIISSPQNASMGSHSQTGGTDCITPQINDNIASPPARLQDGAILHGATSYDTTGFKEIISPSISDSLLEIDEQWEDEQMRRNGLRMPLAVTSTDPSSYLDAVRLRLQTEIDRLETELAT